MNKNSGYTGKNLSGGKDPLERFIHSTIPWKKSRDEAWGEILLRIDTGTERKILKIKYGWMRYAAAAAILTLLGITAFLRLHTLTYTTTPGQQLEVILPDGTLTKLNANTTLNYNPYWWKFSRKVKLDGEAFFEVSMGHELEIISTPGKTIVYGTSFNIFSGNGKYEVTCITGKVKVIASNSGDEVYITQNQKAMLGKTGHLEIVEKTDVIESTAWTRGEFYFTATPLTEVFKKIELSYGIKIRYKPEDNYTYTGYFKKDENIDNILNLVCLAFGIKFEEISKGVYQITRDE